MLRFRRKNRLKRIIKEASYWVRLAQKIRDYRRDLIPEAQLERLTIATRALEAAVASRSGRDIRKAVDQLEPHLRKHGSCYYPKSSWTENIELILVAGILAIGFRTFLLQPFKIPTNSMYPTYNGLTHHIFASEDEEPNLPVRLFRFLTFGASFRRVEAPADGELLIPLFHEAGKTPARGGFPNTRIRGRKWLVLPTYLKEVSFHVGGHTTSLHVPYEFNLDRLIRERFFPDTPEFSEQGGFPNWLNSQVQADMIERRRGKPYLKTGRFFKRGKTVLAFEILTGDALFVDRFSYHFVRPDIGDPFVFRTRDIPGITRQHNGIPVDKYYIKRLVGKGGDILQVKGGTLYRNELPIEGAEAFSLNADGFGEYGGYSNRDRLRVGATDTVGGQNYYAMGDNSDESSDSRVWGFVPQSEIIGRAFFIYYPFTKRWGPAR